MVLAALLLALGSAVGARAPATAPQAPQASQTPSASPEWTRLEQEFFAAWQAHQAAFQRAQQEQKPPPRSPVNDFWDRGVALAQRGEVGAIRWCIAYSDGLDLPPKARGERRAQLYGAWARDLPEGPALREVLRMVQGESHPSRLGAPAAAALCATIADRVQDKGLRGAARVAQGLLVLGAGGPDAHARGRDLIERGIEDDPSGESVPAARGRLFQLEKLRVGLPCPDFTAKDVAGVEFKLSDYAGKVVVLDFWGFW